MDGGQLLETLVAPEATVGIAALKVTWPAILMALAVLLVIIAIIVIAAEKTTAGWILLLIGLGGALFSGYSMEKRKRA